MCWNGGEGLEETVTSFIDYCYYYHHTVQGDGSP